MFQASTNKAVLIILAVFGIALLAWGIHLSIPSHITPHKFALVYTDLAVAYRIYGPDKAKWEDEKSKILKKHNLSPEKLNDFVTLYHRDPEKWAVLWEEVITLLQQRQEKLVSPSPSL